MMLKLETICLGCVFFIAINQIQFRNQSIILKFSTASLQLMILFMENLNEDILNIIHHKLMVFIFHNLLVIHQHLLYIIVNSIIISQYYREYLLQHQFEVVDKMNWNQLSDDSWLGDSQSDQQQKQKVQADTKNTHNTKQTQKNEYKPQKQVSSQGTKQQQTNSKQADGQKKQQNSQHKQQIQKTINKKQSRKYPTDQQLLQQYQTGKVQEKKRLKTINVLNQQQLEIIQNLQKNKKVKKIRNFKEKCYVITFWNKDDLISFIKQKIQKNYKFKLGIYVQSEKQKQWKQQRQKQRAKEGQQRQKQRKDNRQHKQKPRQYKAKFDEDQNKTQTKEDKKPYRKQNDQNEPKKQKRTHRKQADQPENKKQSRKEKDQTQQKRQKKQHNNQHRRQNHGRYNDNSKNQKTGKHQNQDKKHKGIKSLSRQNQRVQRIDVASDEASPEDVIHWLRQQRIPNQFGKFSFLARGSLVNYMEKICQQCHKQLQFGLISDIKQQQCLQKPEQIFKFELKQNNKGKQIQKPMNATYIDKVSQQSFNNVQKNNVHVIGVNNNLGQQSKFDQKQYIQLFKKNYPKIATKCQKFSFYAYNKNIAKLLRLSGTIKKLIPKNIFNYQVGLRQKLPFAKFQISDINKAKLKIDTSVINNHLQD